MLPIPAAFVEKQIYLYHQICKRGRNTLEALASRRYIISEKKWFRTKQYEVNVFGEVMHREGNLDNVLRYALETDKISPMDYQLLEFYDITNMIDHALTNIMERKTAEGEIPVTMDELTLLHDIAHFEEDPNLSKEDLLLGKHL